MSTESERIADRIAYLEGEVEFWKGQQKLAADVAAGIADLDEVAPALRQLLRQERARRIAAEAEVDRLAYQLQQLAAPPPGGHPVPEENS